MPQLKCHTEQDPLERRLPQEVRVHIRPVRARVGALLLRQELCLHGPARDERRHPRLALGAGLPGTGAYHGMAVTNMQ